MVSIECVRTADQSGKGGNSGRKAQKSPRGAGLGYSTGLAGGGAGGGGVGAAGGA